MSYYCARACGLAGVKHTLAELMGRRPPTIEYTPSPTDTFGRVVETKGSHIFTVSHADGTVVEANLPNRFRSQIWIRRGSFVVLCTPPDATLPTISHILSRDDIKELKKAGKWPPQFITSTDTDSARQDDDADSRDDSGSDGESC